MLAPAISCWSNHRGRSRSSLLLLLLAALALATIQASPTRAYRTGRDQPSTADTERVRWASSTVDVYMHTSGVPNVGLAQAEHAILAAFGRWSSSTCSNVNLRYQGTTGASVSGDGINTIIWHWDGWASYGFPSDSAGTTDIIYAKNGAGEWEIREADIHLNGFDLLWAPYEGAVNSSQRSIEAVVAHEVGHLLGALHVCEPDGFEGAPLCSADASFVEHTMFPLYGGPESASLSPDDEAAVCFLYPSPPCAPTCSAGETCRDGACVSTCGGDVCADYEACVADMCVAPCAGDTCTGASCALTSDCDTNENCFLGVCVETRLGQGDPCTASDECATGVCADGFCTRSCNLGCPSGYACMAGICQTSLGVFGEPCESASECASGACLVGSRSTRFCTRACDGLNRPCPDGTLCTTVGAAEVCTPREDSGCVAFEVGRSAHTGSSPFQTILIAIVSIWGARRRREKRTS